MFVPFGASITGLASEPRELEDVDVDVVEDPASEAASSAVASTFAAGSGAEG